MMCEICGKSLREEVSTACSKCYKSVLTGYAETLEENKRLRKIIEDALIDVEMVRCGADDWIEFVEEKLKQGIEGGGSDG